VREGVALHVRESVREGVGLHVRESVREGVNLHVRESVREGVALHVRETPSLARARLHVKEGKLESVSEREWLYMSEKVSGRE